MAEFLDKVKAGIGKGMSTVAVRSKELMDSTRVQNEITSLQDQRKAAVEELGNIAYVMFSKDGFDGERLRSKALGVAAIDQKINERTEELERIHTQASAALGQPAIQGICECGQALGENAKFCARCGKKVG